MPRKKRTIIEETLPEGQGSEDSAEQLSEFDVALESVEDVEALRSVMEQFGETGATLKVYRQQATGNEFCYQTDALDEEFIQKNFGGGDYQVRVFIAGRYRKTMKVKIAARLVSDNGNGNHSSEHRHTDFLERLVLAQVAGGNNNGPSITELTTALANLDGLRGKQESAMDLFQKGVSFAKEIYEMKPSGSGDWKSELVSGIKEALPVVAGMLPGARKPVSTETPNVLTPAVTPTVEQQVAMIKQGLDYLKKKCLAGLEPSFIVEWVENNAEDYQPLIHMVLNLPFDKFVEIDAEIGNEPFKQWFTELFNGLRLAFILVDSVGVDTTGDMGNRDNTGNHGEPRTGKHPKGK